MGRPIKYSANKGAKFSAEEVAKYKEIAAAVSAKGKDKSADAKAAVAKIEAALASAAEEEKKGLGGEADEINTSDADFVGIVLCAEVVSGGELKVDVDDVYMEEPREVVEDEEEADEEERSLWGDGDDDPAEAGED
eukprot:CAMPEP_0113822880 /NCGR_PEP_ID=MMETSP0328-20130328/2464_1 /TAXON_ID=39455 /ORGANISM="Alexandrium minutum" /LENGTH=135 /DNA_ID=CAMNT_0000790821 /DNA_START=81 /DNA_END=488 /DNA_ORIENTATION=+ /assembly_acc=CAM_ASM_000350